MRRISPKIGIILAAVVMFALTAAPPARAVRLASAEPGAGAYFEITDVTGERFVVKLTDPAKIQHARDLVSGTTTSEPHLIGRLIPRPVPYNPRWGYHYNPDTVGFFDMAIEVCDATIPYVEEHLDEAGGAFLPGYIWCPWSSRVIREVSG
ncbi:calmodulin-binding protein [Sphaerisporangium dianthi]|uniref:Calmodulin-binding protein n=1 Tax=Sphaerisporangium dianthi TaxID=1436120 RepID=A0ABV9C7W6_9ACTN